MFCMSKPYETIQVEREQSVVWITLNRPHRLNTFNDAMMDELSEILDTIEEDASVRCVIITGKGDRAFCAGADIGSFAKVTPVMAAEGSRKGQETFSKAEKLSKPVIAAINGYALGGGLELALACDFRIASEHAELGNPEVKRGIIPGWGGTQRLVRIVGLPNAKRLVLVGDRVKADEALEMSLIDDNQNNREVLLDIAKTLIEDSEITFESINY